MRQRLFFLIVHCRFFCFIDFLLIFFSLPEPFYVKCLPKGGGGVTTSSLDFAVKPLILMILVLEDRYKSSFH